MRVCVKLMVGIMGTLLDWGGKGEGENMAYLDLWQVHWLEAIYSIESWIRPQGCILTHWGQVMPICVSELTIMGSDNRLSSVRRQAIIWTNAAILLIRPQGTYLSEISFKIEKFSFKKMAAVLSRAEFVNSLALAIGRCVILKLHFSIIWLASSQ